MRRPPVKNASAVVAAAAAAVAVVVAVQQLAPEPTLATRSVPERQAAAASRTQVVLGSADQVVTDPVTGRREDPTTLGDVLASARTSAGRVDVVHFQFPDGRECIVQRFEDRSRAGGMAGRCADTGGLFTRGQVDLAAGISSLPGGGAVSVVWGAVPSNTDHMVLAGSATEIALTPGPEVMPGYRFVVAEAPVQAAAVGLAFDRAGRLLSRSEKPFPHPELPVIGKVSS